VLAFALLIAALNACEPLVLKYVFDRVGGNGVASALAIGVAGMLALGLVRELLTGVQNWLTWKTRIEVQFSLTSATVGRLQQLPLSFHRNSGVGATMTKLDRGVQGFVTALNELAFNIVPSAAYLVLALVMMFRLSPRPSR
jgi:ATP-binding cassette, subfamily B, bacterial